MLKLKGDTDPVNCLAFSVDGRRLATAKSDPTRLNDVGVRIWDTDTAKELLTLKGHTGAVLCVAFSPDGKRLASAGYDATIRLWDTATGQELLILKGHIGRVHSLAFSPDGQRLASAGEDSTVRIWEASPVPVNVWRRPRCPNFSLVRSEGGMAMARGFSQWRDGIFAGIGATIAGWVKYSDARRNRDPRTDYRGLANLFLVKRSRFVS